jgi:fructose-bisphosphate aldolase, class I
MPMMVEPLVLRPEGGAYGVDGDVERILGVVRQAVELGADVIKADPSDDLLQYHRVVEAARVPVLVRGGGRVPDDVLLERTRAVLVKGAAGIVYGRNIIQHASPRGITRALMAMVHDDAPVDRALAMLEAEAVQ